MCVLSDEFCTDIVPLLVRTHFSLFCHPHRHGVDVHLCTKTMDTCPDAILSLALELLGFIFSGKREFGRAGKRERERDAPSVDACLS